MPTATIDDKKKKPSTVAELKAMAAKMKPPSVPSGYVLTAAPTPSLLQQFRNAVANSAVGHSIEETMPRLSTALDLHPSETVNSPTYQQHKEQIIAPEYLTPAATKAINLVSPVPLTRAGEERLEGGLHSIGGLTSAPSMATIVGTAVGAGLTAGVVNPATLQVLSRLTAGGFTLDMLRGLYQQNKEYRNAIDSGNLDEAHRIQGEMGVTGLMAGLTGYYALAPHPFTPIEENDIPTRVRTNVLHRNAAGEVRQAAGQAPSVWLSPKAWESFMGTLYPHEDANATHGVNLPANEHLQSFADDPQLSAANPDFADVQELLSKANKSAGEGGIAIAKQRPSIQKNVNVMREELNHTWQRSLSNGDVTGHLSPEAFDALHKAIPKGMQEHLIEQGYDGVSAPEMVTEAAAKLLDGRPERFGVTPDEAVDFLDDYFQRVKAQHGTKALEDLHHVRGIAADAKARAIREHSGSRGEQNNGAIPSVGEGWQGGTAEGLLAGPEDAIFNRERDIQDQIDNYEEKLNEERAKGIKFYFPEDENLLKTNVYSGPEYTPESLLKASHSFNDAHTENQSRDIVKLMKEGMSFKDAIQSYGSASLAEKLGGKMDSNGPIPDNYKPYPKDLTNLYAQRDAIGSKELNQSIDEISNALRKTGISEENDPLYGSEMNRVLKYYALDPTKTDVFGQYMASEHTMPIVSKDPKEQVADIYAALAPMRDIPMDDYDDLWKNNKLTRDSIAVVKAIHKYFNGRESPNIKGLLGEGDSSLFSREKDKPIWYLKSERLINEKMRGPQPADDVRKMLIAGGVKPDEMQWTGLDDFLDAKGKEKVTPEEVKEHLANNNIQVKEVTKGGPLLSPEEREELDSLTSKNLRASLSPEDESRYKELLEKTNFGSAYDNDAIYKQYQLPGAINGSYREMLLTIPLAGEERGLNSFEKSEMYALELRERGLGRPLTDAEMERYLQLHARDIESAPYRYISPHWDEPNVLAHVRYNDRTGTNGEKLLHLEEIQSDAHQAARTKGYADPKIAKELEKKAFVLKAKYDEANRNLESLRKELLHQEVSGNPQRIDEIKDQSLSGLEKRVSVYEELRKVEQELDNYTRNNVPPMPFSKTWHEMALRRMIRKAVDEGYSGLSWTGGEDQNARYSLNTQVDKIAVSGVMKDGYRNVQIFPKKEGGHGRLLMGVAPDGTVDGMYDASRFTGRKLDDVVGKDMARKIMDAKEPTTFEGKGLEIGGSGQKGFYDKIVPDYLNKFGKKFGAKVGEITPKTGKPTNKSKFWSSIRSDGRFGEMPLYAIFRNGEWAGTTGDPEAGDGIPGEVLVKVADEDGNLLKDAKLPWDKEEGKTFQYLPITPEMRQSVAEEGVPLFSRETPKNKEEFRNWDFVRPMGGSSVTPKRIFNWRDTGQLGETLHDLSGYDDDWRLREAITGDGRGYVSPVLLKSFKEDRPITVYRTSEDGGIIPGAYVSESRKYALDHAAANIRSPWKLHKLEVRPSELMTYGDPHEFIYAPSSVDEAYARYLKQVENGEFDKENNGGQDRGVLGSVRGWGKGNTEGTGAETGQGEGTIDKSGPKGDDGGLQENRGVEGAFNRDQEKTPEFKAWFGDSKVVDDKGNPLIVYHGSPDARFMQDDATFKSQKDRFGYGEDQGVHWFTPSRKTATTYADDHRAFDYQNAEPHLIPTYLKMENPLEIDANGKEWRDAQRIGKTRDIIKQAREDGHDGIIIRNVKDDYNNDQKTKPTDTYAVFDSNQIKHAFQNKGTFDATNPNILFNKERGGEDKQYKVPTETGYRSMADTGSLGIVDLTPKDYHLINTIIGFGYDSNGINISQDGGQQLALDVMERAHSMRDMNEARQAYKIAMHIMMAVQDNGVGGLTLIKVDPTRTPEEQKELEMHEAVVHGGQRAVSKNGNIRELFPPEVTSAIEKNVLTRKVWNFLDSLGYDMSNSATMALESEAFGLSGMLSRMGTPPEEVDELMWEHLQAQMAHHGDNLNKVDPTGKKYVNALREAAERHENNKRNRESFTRSEESRLGKGSGEKEEIPSPSGASEGRGTEGNTGDSGAGSEGVGSEREGKPNSKVNPLFNRDRRVDYAQRKRVSEMTPEELRKELLTSDKTGIPNKRAFDEEQHVSPAPAVGMSDADGLKALNDRFGYAAGDELLRAKAEALKEAGLDAYHDKGDEFLYRGESPDSLKDKLEKARNILRNRIIEVTMKDGTKLFFKGADFSYGTGKNIEQSESELKEHKQEREQRGERARGELRGITQIESREGKDNSSAAQVEEKPKTEGGDTALFNREQSKTHVYDVYIHKAYFPQEMRPTEAGKEDFEQWTVRASSRDEAAKKIWDMYGSKLLSLMSPHTGSLPRKVSLYVSNPKTGTPPGRLQPILVEGNTIPEAKPAPRIISLKEAISEGKKRNPNKSGS